MEEFKSSDHFASVVNIVSEDVMNRLAFIDKAALFLMRDLIDKEDTIDDASQKAYQGGLALMRAREDVYNELMFESLTALPDNTGI